MPIPLPNLDDRTYADLVEEARALIPTLYPDWTDHNPTDPGIVLTEMLAWLVDMMIYRINQIPDDSYAAYLKLLKGDPNWQLASDTSLEQAVQDTIRDLRERYRAVTCADFEYLALKEWPKTPEAKALGMAGIIKRALCLPNHKTDEMEEVIPPSKDKPLSGHVCLIVVPADRSNSDSQNSKLLEKLHTFLDERRLLTTHHHVAKPAYVGITVSATLFLRPDANTSDTQKKAKTTIQSFFDPLEGGPEGGGWPFGRDVYISEVYACLDQVSGIDYVRDVAIEIEEEGKPQLAAYELVGTVTLDFRTESSR